VVLKNTFLIDTLSYAEVNFATALVPSDIACLASSPGKVSRTAVCISRDVSVFVLLIFASLLASVASLSKMSLMNEFMMFMALLDIPVSECTCFRTLKIYKDHVRTFFLFPFLDPFAPLGAFAALGAFPFPPIFPDFAGIAVDLTF